MESSVFSAAAFANPNITSADKASSFSAVIPEISAAEYAVSPPLPILSFNSMTSLCAVFSPIPYMLFILLTSLHRIAVLISSGLMDESIILAVFGPIPDTEMSIRKMLLSSLSWNP